MANTIGIDFGTTKTMVSYLNPTTGRPELVRLGRDRDSIPTTVQVDENGEFLFGEDADDQIEMDPEGYCRAFKLHLGEKEAVLPRLGITAEALTARFLQHIKVECEQSVFHGDQVTSATITIPVSFSPARKSSLKRAAEKAGFAKVSFLPEPEVAGIAFLRDNPQDKFSRALVLDWGGGTLDIAIISRDEDGNIHADRHCTEGYEGMGGEEMDIGLLQNIAVMWEAKYGESLIKEVTDEVRFLRDSQKTKELLTKKETTFFRCGPKKQDITREMFNHIIYDLLDEVVKLVASALAKNRAKGNPEPDALILIGGSCQIPAVRQTMEQNFPNLRVLSWHHSHEAVALGATKPKATIAETSKLAKGSGAMSREGTTKGVPLRVQGPRTTRKEPLTNPFVITNEAIRLFARQCVVNGRRSATKRRFVEDLYPSVLDNSAWTGRLRSSETVEDLALAAVESYQGKTKSLAVIAEKLQDLAECNGHPTEDERYSMSLIRYYFGLRKSKPKPLTIQDDDDEGGLLEEVVAPTDDSWGVGTGAAVGATLGTLIPGVGTLVGAGIGALIGGVKKLL